MDKVELQAIDRTISLQLDLIRHSRSIETRIVDLMEQMRAEVVGKLSKGNLTEFGRARLNALLKDTAQVVDWYFQQAQKMLNPSLAQIPGVVAAYEPLAVGNLAVTLSKYDEKLGYKLVNIDVAKLDEAFKRDSAFYVGPDGVGGINGRYSRVKQFITDNQTFEASSVIIGSDGSVGFENGRHRYAALRDASNRVIPVAMDEASIANAESAGYLVKSGPTSTVDVLLQATVPSQKVIDALIKDLLIEGAPSANWWKRQSMDTAFRFSNAIRQGIAQGETNDQIYRRVGQITDLAAKNSRALVHTSIMQVAGDARMAVIDANTDLYVGYRQLSTLDGHTTSLCMARSGLKWTLEKQPIGHNLPFKPTPLHWGCRSVILGIMRPLTDYGLKETRGMTRSSAEGQIDRNTTFDAFLSRRTVAQQNEQLGVGRATMFREGKITLRQLVDSNGNQLTLQQLEKKYGKSNR